MPFNRAHMDLRGLAATRQLVALAHLLWCLFLTLGFVPIVNDLDWTSRIGVALVVCVIVLADLSLLFGWRVRSAAFLAWLGHLALQWILHLDSPFGSVLSISLLCCAVLPVGHAWSIDAALDQAMRDAGTHSNSSTRHTSLSQMILVLGIIGWGIVLFVATLGAEIGLALALHFGLWLPTLLDPRLVLERLDQWKRSGGRDRMRIAYDGNCTFCRRMVYVLRSALGLGAVAAGPAQDDPVLHETMKRENSWVVVDSNGLQHLRFDGVICCVAASIWLWPAAWILRLAPIHAIGEGAYRYIANHRSGAGRATSAFRYHELPHAATPSSQLLALLVLLLMASTIPTLRHQSAGKQAAAFRPKPALLLYSECITESLGLTALVSEPVAD